MCTSKPPATSPNVGKAGFGSEASTTRGVPPVQLGAAHGPMLLANGTYCPGTGTSPLLPPNAITGMSMLAAWVRFSMSRRPRPTESAVESSEIPTVQAPSLVQGLPTLPVTQNPAEHVPADVTLRPAPG